MCANEFACLRICAGSSELTDSFVLLVDGRTDGRLTDRLFASARCKNEKIQIHEPTHEILVMITFSSTECLFKSAQMSRLAKA